MKMKQGICMLLLLSMCLCLFSCSEATSQENKTVDLMANITPSPVSFSEPIESGNVALADFSVNLLQNTYEDKNCVLSPYSLYTALAMTANGTGGNTRKQMEQLLGMSISELNARLYALAQKSGDELHCSNSVWFRQREGFAPNDEFLQLNADFYGADIFGAAFDEDTLHDINTWICEKTHGKIENAMDSIDPNTMMFMLNVLTFDAEWQKPYETSQVKPGTFYASVGEEGAMMMSAEEEMYLDDSEAVGFMKPYKNDRYSFLALLPNGDLEQYIKNLNGEKLLNTVRNASAENVLVTMPKFELEYNALLNEPLSAMGMSDAFTAAADLSNMSNADLFISKVIHKTYFRLDERGTQAGAASIVSADYKSIAFAPKRIVLDRPFLMGIFDSENECFIFLGAVNSLRG